MKKLPIGIQTFSEIIKENYVYVDKTEIAYNLINEFKYVFLSRPRRFGKSLFLDTLKELFKGNKELFKGLYIYDKWNWEEKYPVIKISWDGKNRTINDLEQKLKEILKDNQERLQVKCEDELDLIICFERLIKEAYKKYNQKVVILVDEYDKPILDVIEDLEQAKLHREFIKGLYSVIKGSDAYIRFTFLTGVSKFSKASIFSGLNMLTDISLNERYGNICGYTQEDLETVFADYLKNADMEKIKEWYNGYNFLKDNVYNPFDILQFIANGFKFKNYWFSTGTPTFLIKLIEKNKYFLPKLSDLIVDEKLVDSFDIENIDIEVILYQSGYLTISEVRETPFETIEYKLSIPNKEVKISLNDFIIKYLLNTSDSNREKSSLYLSLLNANLKEFEDTLKSIFSSIPYNNYSNNFIQNYEGFYASVVYIYLQSLGLQIIGEDVTNKGRIDLTVFIGDKIYIIEFKVDANKGEALNQIKEKNYSQKYLNKSLEIYLVGIEFDSKDKNIVNFEYEKLKS
ncbi:MAG: AAA-ATPase [Deferribacteraceae bacterium]|nr:AAA-ATPase [Deferribacteraceae bacterium]